MVFSGLCLGSADILHGGVEHGPFNRSFPVRVEAHAPEVVVNKPALL